MSNVSTANLSDEVLVNELTSLIKNIAQCNASDVKSSKKQQKWDYKLDKITPIVIKNINADDVDNGLTFLKQSLEVVANEGYFVTSQESGLTLPFGYEVLKVIFAKSDEKFRQVHFERLTNFYYKEVAEKLGNYPYATKDQFDRQIKAVLPLAKLETLSENHHQSSDLLLNLQNFFHSPRLNQEDIYIVIKNKISSNNFDLKSYELVPLKQRNGHLGDYYQLNICYNHEDQTETIVLFAKFLTAKVELIRDFLKLGPSMKEEFFYVTYLRQLKEIGLTELVDFAPNCYFSRVDDVIILDDLSTFGLVALTPDIKLDYNTLCVVLRSLAKMHACSIILEERLSQKEGQIVRLDEKYGQYMKEIFFVPESQHIKKGPTDFLQYFFNKFPDFAGQHSIDTLIEKAKKGWDLCYEKVKKSSKFRNVICHGDVYVSNMLFKFDENKVCQAVTLVDFQILRYCPPTQDLLFFLYQNTFKKTLDEHFSDLIETYYTALTDCLEKYNLDIKSVYPREDFEESVNYMKLEGIFQAMFYSRFQTINPKLREKIVQDEEEMQRMKSDGFYLISKSLEEDHYRKVMEGLVSHFLELCNNGEL